MKKVIYVNRYGDKIQFEDKEYTVEMSGYNPEWIRYGVEEDPNIINMVDPSGGPYITVGEDLRSFFNDKKPRIVKAINMFPGVIEFVIE